jgi:hypothetical protein
LPWDFCLRIPLRFAFAKAQRLSRGTVPRIRSVVTDSEGRFEIHGIAPGSYKLFAWPELEGAAYRNAEFMKEFEERGKPVKIEKGPQLTVDQRRPEKAYSFQDNPGTVTKFR